MKRLANIKARLKVYAPKVNVGTLVMFAVGLGMFVCAFFAQSQGAAVIVAAAAGGLIGWSVFDATVLRFWKAISTRWQNAAERTMDLLEASDDRSIEVPLDHDQIAELNQSFQDYLNKIEAGEIAKTSCIMVTLGREKGDADPADS